MDPNPSVELLEANHTFPGVYQIKAIGDVAGDFEARVLRAVRTEVGGDASLVHTVRATSSGRHVALTMDVAVENAEQVRRIYTRVRALDGLLLLL